MTALAGQRLTLKRVRRSNHLVAVSDLAIDQLLNLMVGHSPNLFCMLPKPWYSFNHDHAELPRDRHSMVAVIGSAGAFLRRLVW